MLYLRDLNEAVAAPAGIGDAVTIASETRRIGAKAFAACEKLESIVALGHVEDIAADAFAQTVCEKAVVALAPGEDYDARKAVWEAAGFQNFAEQVAPGETMRSDDESDTETPGGGGGLRS